MNKGQLQINELSTILNEHFHWNKGKNGLFRRDAYGSNDCGDSQPDSAGRIFSKSGTDFLTLSTNTTIL